MFLKNKNIIFKIRRSKVTDYAALSVVRIMAYLKTIMEVYGKTFTYLDLRVIKQCNAFLNSGTRMRKLSKDSE